MASTEVWEYRVDRVPTHDLKNLHLRMTQFGSTGWEVVGFAAADKTIGLNEYAVILKRRTPGLPPPAELEPGWKADPLGRAQYRWWTGLHWDSAVNDAGKNSIDWPLPDR